MACRYNSRFMSRDLRTRSRLLCFLVVLFAVRFAQALSGVPWNGVLVDSSGKPVASAVVSLHSSSDGRGYMVTTSPDGYFAFATIAAGSYELSVKLAGKEWKGAAPLVIGGDGPITTSLQLSASGQVLQAVALSKPTPSGKVAAPASGGEHLSSAEVSSLPLNARDFSKLLLLAAGTMTDANGAANFTQQFAVNGQRGVTTVFAIGWLRHDGSGDGRRHIFEFQCRRHSGSAIKFRA